MTLQSFKQLYCDALRDLKFSSRSDIGESPLRVFSKNTMFCPITVVYYKMTGIYVPTQDAFDTAKSMGLSEKFIDLIMDAADQWWRTGQQKTFVHWLRTETMKAIPRIKSNE